MYPWLLSTRIVLISKLLCCFRVCVGVVLPEGVQLRVAMVVVSPDNKENGGDEGLAKKRSSMHVQSLSEWAPANIGPYSQAYTVSTWGD